MKKNKKGCSSGFPNKINKIYISLSAWKLCDNLKLQLKGMLLN